MEDERFDQLARVLGAPRGRRSLLRALVGVAAGGLLTRRGEETARAACSPPLLECGGPRCVDIETDPNHCGSCVNACPLGHVCCGSILISPFGLCADTASDPNHCGACYHACGENQYCSFGSCFDLIPACVAPLIPCGDQCADVANDANHCGTCNNNCGSFGYGYVQPACCSGVCVDLDSHVNHCGGCGLSCGADQVCEGGACACSPGLTDCNGVCADLGADPYHCGACGNACVGVPGPNQSSIGACVDGACQIVCLEGFSACGLDCVDLQSDPDHCGGCGIACGNGQACVSGGCDGSGAGCPAGQTDCFGRCVDQRTDVLHCGACGNGCTGVPGPNQSSIGACVDGTCQIVCLEGFTACGSDCVDPQTDHDHCGGCDQPCPASRHCVDGRCRATAAPTPTAAPATGDDPWRLWLGTTKLRGAVLYQRRRTAADELAVMGDGAIGPRYTRSDLDHLAELGANYVDIVHPAIVAEQAPHDLDAAALDSLDRLVDLAATAGLYVVVSLRTGPGRPEASLAGDPRCRAGGCFAPAADASLAGEEATLWGDEAAQAGWELAWREVAAHFRGHPAVVGYHLLDAAGSPDLAAWGDLTRRLTAAVRATDARTPILVTLPGRPVDSFAEPLTEDERTVHLLDLLEPERFLTQAPDTTGALTYPGRFNPARDDGDGAFDRSWLEARIALLLAFEDRERRPTALRAIGVPRWQPGAADYLDDAMSLCDGAGLNHALWAWYPAGWPAAGDAFDVTRGPDPATHEPVESELLAVVRSHWRANDDRPVSNPR